MLETRGPSAEAKAAQELLQARVAVEIRDKSLSSLKAQEREARLQIKEAEAVQKFEEAAAAKERLDAHMEKVNAILAQLHEFEEGGEYVVKPRPSLQRVMADGPQVYVWPKSYVLRTEYTELLARAEELKVQAAVERQQEKSRQDQAKALREGNLKREAERSTEPTKEDRLALAAKIR